MKPATLLIAVKSPLQVLNAVEYCRRQKAEGRSFEVNAIIFCSARKPALSDLLRRLLQGADCASIYLVPVLPAEKGWWYSRKECRYAQRFARGLARALAHLPAPDEVIIGDYRSLECRHLTSLFPNTPVVLLDDGSATHQIARFRRNPDDPELAPMFPRNDFRAFRLKLWADIQLPFIEKLTFFTHYAIAVPAQDNVVTHRYEFWRSLVRDKPRQPANGVLFLGMSHVEKNLTTRTRYLETLQKIKRFYKDRPIIYRPHRDETVEKLDAVRELGFLIAEPDVTPVELLLIESPTLPCEVASIASSALDNLAVVFANVLTLRCFTPEPDYCNARMAGHFTDIIRYHIGGVHNNLEVSALADQTAR